MKISFGYFGLTLVTLAGWLAKYSIFSVCVPLTVTVPQVDIAEPGPTA